MVKHPYKVHVWAGISKRGATRILIFMGIMKKRILGGEYPSGYISTICPRQFPDARIVHRVPTSTTSWYVN